MGFLVQDQVTVKGYIYGRNRAGLVIAVAGFPCFMPRSLMTDSVVMIHNKPDEVDSNLSFSKH